MDTDKPRINGRDEKGRFGLGNPGRQPMTANKLQQSIRDKLGEFLEGKLEDLEGIYSKLADRDKGKFVLEVISYFMPKQSEIYVEGSIDNGEQDLSRWSEEDLRTLIKLHERYKQ